MNVQSTVQYLRLNSCTEYNILYNNAGSAAWWRAQTIKKCREHSTVYGTISGEDIVSHTKKNLGCT